LAGALALPFAARAQSPLRVGVLTTLSGPAAEGAGAGSVLAAQMALEAWPGVPATLVAADMGERPDTGAAIAGAWFDRDGVDVIVDVPNSATALAVATLARARDKAALFSGPGTTLLSGPQCSPNHLQWTYDTAALAASTGRAVLAEGGRTWFFLTADYVFGHGLQRDIASVVQEAGGRVVGAASFPNETADFSPLLLQAQASGAEIVALACTGAPFETLVKQAAEFGLARAGQRIASPLCLITNVHAIGLEAAHGLLATEPFYWDLDPATRAFAARFMPRNRGIAPTMVHAGVFSAVNHLLRTLSAEQARGAALIAAMKRVPVQDELFASSVIRANGSVAHAMHLLQVKLPAESGGEWDVYRNLRTTPPEQAYPITAGCALAPSPVGGRG